MKKIYLLLKFEWDSNKDLANRKKHFVSFEEAKTIWSDSRAIEFFDPDHSDHEDRFLRIGYSNRSRLLLTVFCERDQGKTIRIISARKTTDQERSQHEEGI